MNVERICVEAASLGAQAQAITNGKNTALGVVRVVTFMNYDQIIVRYTHSPGSNQILYCRLKHPTASLPLLFASHFSLQRNIYRIFNASMNGCILTVNYHLFGGRIKTAAAAGCRYFY